MRTESSDGQRELGSGAEKAPGLSRESATAAGRSSPAPRVVPSVADQGRILEFQDVSFASDRPHVVNLSGVNMALGPRELALVLLADAGDGAPVCDLAEGLLEPDGGRVAFLGEDWSRMSARRRWERRSVIGRVFDSSGWLSNLSVAENLTLALLHHSRRTESSIFDEMGRIGRSFGLDAIPEERPHLVAQGLLRRWEWVRAFLGEPKLVLMERPERDAPKEHVGSLVSVLAGFLELGGSAVWITSDREVWSCPGLSKGRKYVLRDDCLELTQ